MYTPSSMYTYCSIGIQRFILYICTQAIAITIAIAVAITIVVAFVVIIIVCVLQRLPFYLKYEKQRKSAFSLILVL